MSVGFVSLCLLFGFDCYCLCTDTTNTIHIFHFKKAMSVKTPHLKNIKL